MEMQIHSWTADGAFGQAEIQRLPRLPFANKHYLY